MLPCLVSFDAQPGGTSDGTHYGVMASPSGLHAERVGIFGNRLTAHAGPITASPLDAGNGPSLLEEKQQMSPVW